jgi:glycosyltransferase involved in cell wall biosynthesis
MDISVIIPAFNRAHTLKRALDSVLAQSYPASEIIVVDDASVDNTELLMQAYVQIKFIKLIENRGVSHARNEGIKQARTEWIALLDSDDEWNPDKLAKQVAAAKAYPGVHAFHTNEIWIRNGKRVNQMNKHVKPDGWVYEASLSMCCISPSSILLHRSLLEQCGGFDESLPACEDYDLWLRIFSRYPVKLIDEPLVIKYGGHADQLSRQHWGMDRFRIKAMIKVLDSEFLGERDRALTVAMLRHKCSVLIKGAQKRSRHESVAKYQSIADRYADEVLT